MRGAGGRKRGRCKCNGGASDATGQTSEDSKVREAALYGAIGGTREELSAVESAVTSTTTSDTTRIDPGS